MSSESARRFWERSIALVAFRVNFAFVLERFRTLGFGVVSLLAVFVFAQRRLGHVSSYVWVAGIGAIFMAAAVATYLSKRRFFARRDARVLLEHRLGLDTALTAADSGVVPWPARIENFSGILRWDPRASLVWGAGAAAVFALAVWLPIPDHPSGPLPSADLPPALAQTESWLLGLEKLAVASPESVETFAERARELSARSGEERYAHSALEAADALRDQAAAAMQALAGQFDAAASALSPLENSDGAPTDAELKAAGEQLSVALRGMREGALSPRAEMLKSLTEISAGDMRGLTPEQASQLRQRLTQAGRETRGIAGAAGEGAEVAKGDGESADGTARWGRGGVKRGPGQAPLMFSDTSSEVGPGRGESLANDDLSRASLGDLLGTQRSEHAVDVTRTQTPSGAGAVAAPAAGGEAVWVDRLTPAERAALKEFFK